jgi:hypothetical protein
METATVSVLVSGAVGIGGLTVPLVTARMSDRRQRREARDARFDELREVVDAAAVALMAVREAQPELEEVQGGFDEVRLALPRLRTALMKVWQQEARLAARLGLDADIVRRYRVAHDALGALHVYWSAVVYGEQPEQTFDEANDAVQPAISDFFASAAARVGPERVS